MKIAYYSHGGARWISELFLLVVIRTLQLVSRYCHLPFLKGCETGWLFFFNVWIRNLLWLPRSPISVHITTSTIDLAVDDSPPLQWKGVVRIGLGREKTYRTPGHSSTLLKHVQRWCSLLTPDHDTGPTSSLLVMIY